MSDTEKPLEPEDEQATEAPTPKEFESAVEETELV